MKSNPRGYTMFALVLLITSPIAQQTLDLSTLSPITARSLDGQSVRVSFVVDSLRGEFGVDAVGVEGVSAGVLFAGSFPDVTTGRRLTVEGTMRVRWHPERVIGGERFPEVLAVDVVGAREVGP
jgi:hypothetical protein